MRFRHWLVTIPLLIVLLAPVSSGQTALVPLPADLRGELNGVPYHIVVPSNWNGTLLVYAYGYAEAYDAPLTPMAPAATDAQLLLAKGYALAGVHAAGSVTIPGAQTDAGYNMKERIQATAALTAAFRDMVGRPKQTIAWGKSMGGLVALALIEKFPGLFDGAVPLCAPGAGTPRMFDQKLDITLAYAVAFGWKDEWGTPDNIRPDLNFMTEVAPLIKAQLTPENMWRWEFLRLVNRIPADKSFYEMSPPFLFQTLWLAFVPRPDLNMRAGGRVDQNVGRVYSLRDEDWALLLNEFNNISPHTLRANVNALLAQMNTGTIYAADINARNYGSHYYEPTGRITRPVLTLHTTHDAAAIPNNESAYRRAVGDQGKEALLMQQFTTGVQVGDKVFNTHCTFTPPQYLAGIEAMVQWLKTGTRPNPSDFFTEALGFDPKFVPDPWPW